MNTEDSEFERIEREAKMRLPDAIGPEEGESPEYMAGWNDCRSAMAEQPALAEPDVDRLIALARADEREACAKVCENEWSNVAERMYGEECAAAIRARSKNEDRN